jgi:hypothetical protein
MSSYPFKPDDTLSSAGLSTCLSKDIEYNDARIRLKLISKQYGPTATYSMHGELRARKPPDDHQVQRWTREQNGRFASKIVKIAMVDNVGLILVFTTSRHRRRSILGRPLACAKTYIPTFFSNSRSSLTSSDRGFATPYHWSTRASQ